MSTNYSGACFCGAVEIEVSGQPEAMGYCHCQSCRSWSASPVNAFTLWKPENVKVTKGADQIGAYHKTEKHHRQFCRTCGGHVMSRLPAWGLIDVFSADTTFPNLLTGIIDENGVRFATWTYDSLARATSSQHAGGERHRPQRDARER